MPDTTKRPLDPDSLPPRTPTRPSSTGVSLGIVLTLVMVTRASAQVPASGERDTASRVQPSRDARCRVLSSAFIAKARKEWNHDYTLLRVEAFYSSVLDACIHAEIAEVGVYANIRDLSHTFFRENPLGFVLWCSNHGIEHANCSAILPSENLLYCDPDGANSVIVNQVRKYRGWVDTLSYAEWLDDGFGGPPATLKTPEKPYTKEQCALLYGKWIKYLRGGPESIRR